MKLSNEQIELLSKALPPEAVKDHPVRTGMSTITPMYIIDRLNEVFGVTGWSFTTEFLSCTPAKQKTKNGDRDVYIAYVKGRFEYEDCVIEQYGGNTNDDAGDALKGSATDALTKIASYLGIGAEIYKGNGNIDGGDTPEVPPNVSTPTFNRFKRD